MDAGPAGKGGGGELAEELLPGAEAEQVVAEAGGEDDEDGWQQVPGERKGLSGDMAARERGEEEDAVGGEAGDENGDASDMGDGMGMEFAEVVGAVDPAGECYLSRASCRGGTRTCTRTGAVVNFAVAGALGATTAMNSRQRK